MHHHINNYKFKQKIVKWIMKLKNNKFLHN